MALSFEAGDVIEWLGNRLLVVEGGEESGTVRQWPDGIFVRHFFWSARSKVDGHIEAAQKVGRATDRELADALRKLQSW